MSRLTAVVRGLAVAVALAVCLPQPKVRAGFPATFTYYNLTGIMANGEYVYPGAAACPVRYMGWTVHVIAPDVYLVCADTGAAYWFEQGDIRIDVWSLGRPWWMSGAGAQVWEVEMWP